MLRLTWRPNCLRPTTAHPITTVLLSTIPLTRKFSTTADRTKRLSWCSPCPLRSMLLTRKFCSHWTSGHQPLEAVRSVLSGPNSTFGVQLVIATLIGIAIYAASLVAFEFAGGHSAAGRAEPVATIPAPKPLSAAAQALGVELPTVFGVYAISGGKLYELEPLPQKVPDARIAISAIISNSSHVALPEGKVQFILFRRDLVASAPTEVFVRVVARVVREMKFNANGPPSTTNIDGEWAVRSKSYTFKVAPLGDNPEMVVLPAVNSQDALSPGRYALVLAGKGYDFTVEGQVTDAAQCVERTTVIGGTVYSECRTLASQLAN